MTLILYHNLRPPLVSLETMEASMVWPPVSSAGMA
jgi:hypothetical protein